MKVHVKKIHLVHALEILANYDVLYKVEEGMCFGKNVYWIELHSESDIRDEVVNAIRTIGHLSEDSDDYEGVHIDDAALDAIERIHQWHLEWKSGHRNNPDEWPLSLPEENSGILFESICIKISE